ncbi:MAG: outer membrane protein assembly factor BamE [Gammaproteobacteria bacterium]|nr:outer membrane protein assembly factor BamE [Gammaproteobacteria bacterium]
MSRSALRQCFNPLGLTAVLLLSACSSLEFPGVYKLTIQQGNIVSQEMVDRLKPGMTRSQVQFVLGNPVLADSFERDRWNYVYTIDIPGQATIERELIIVFEDDRLLRFEGDYTPSESKVDATAS